MSPGGNLSPRNEDLRASSCLISYMTSPDKSSKNLYFEVRHCPIVRRTLENSFAEVIHGVIDGCRGGQLSNHIGCVQNALDVQIRSFKVFDLEYQPPVRLREHGHVSSKSEEMSHTYVLDLGGFWFPQNAMPS